MKAFLIHDHVRLDGDRGRAIGEPAYSVTRGARIELHAARNEYASFQLVIEGYEGARGEIAIEMDALPGGESRVYYAWQHRVDKSWIPDALLPWEDRARYELAAQGKLCMFWIDVFIPRGVDPGTHPLKLALRAEGNAATMDVIVHVAEAVLCDESLMIADMNSYADSISQSFDSLRADGLRYKNGAYARMDQALHRIAHEHRATYHSLGYDHSGRVLPTYAPEIEGEGYDIRVKSWDVFDQHFGPLLDGSAFSGTARGAIPIPYLYLPFNFHWPASYEKFGTEGYRVEFRRILAEFIRHFEEMGWNHTRLELFFNHKKRYRFFPYDGDEIRFMKDEFIIEYYDEIARDLLHDTKLDIVLRMDSSWAFGHQYHTRVSDVMKMWAVGSGILAWYPEACAFLRKKGCDVLTYLGLPGMDQSLLHLLMWPMRCLLNDIHGFLYWNANGFGGDWTDCPTGKGNMAAWYPGSPFGIEAPLPTIRLKYLRNAVQIADLIRMHEARPAQGALRAVLCSAYGLSEGEWSDPRPAFADDDPATWTNEKIGGAPHRDFVGGYSPDLVLQIKRAVLHALGGK